MTQIVQIAVAVLIGAAIFALGRWGIRLLATPVPGEPDPDEIVAVDRHYRCAVCGMRLTVTHAPDEDVSAPRHCREEMEEVAG
ncbi:MAG: hypothetical protein A2Z12_00415 [Actinobacteria bacterium RBG_16_68_21]|nr:MAG: hypothetical protein A2Z12_00415 [Actinobacteria bacterium RBG_16_68_21]